MSKDESTSLAPPAVRRRAGARAARSALVALALATAGCRSAPPGDGAATAASGAAVAASAAKAPASASVATAPRPAASDAGHGWNDAAIDWQPFDAGIEKAKKDKKPVCLVLYTSWCPHCKNYSHVFEDPKVVAKARDFVMIRVNSDESTEIAKRYSPDGGYIPRTMFLASDGTLDPEIRLPRDKYKYFYDEHDPASILGGMDAALKKLAK